MGKLCRFLLQELMGNGAGREKRSMSSPERMFCMCKTVEMLCKIKLCIGFNHLNPGRHWPFKLKLLQGEGVGVYYLH